MWQSDRFSNLLTVVGKLTKPVKALHHPQGPDTALGTIASNTYFNTQDGKRRKTAFIQFTANGYLARELLAKGAVGSQWVLTGHLETIDRKCPCGAMHNAQILRVERFSYPDTNPSTKPATVDSSNETDIIGNGESSLLNGKFEETDGPNAQNS